MVSFEGHEERDAHAATEDEGGEFHDLGEVLIALCLRDRVGSLCLVDFAQKLDVRIL